MTQTCSRLPASMLAAPCATCGVYDKECVHAVGSTPEYAIFYCSLCCPRCVTHIGSFFVPTVGAKP